MNKNILKISLSILFIFAAFFLTPQRVFALGEEDYTASAFVSIPSGIVPSDLIIHHTQPLTVFTSTLTISSISINGYIGADAAVQTINSVKIQYFYDDDIIISVITSTYNTSASTFDGLIDNLIFNKGALYYQIFAEYDLGGINGIRISSSPWYVIHNPGIFHTPISGISALDKTFHPIAYAEHFEVNPAYANIPHSFEIEYYYDDNLPPSTAALKLVGTNFELANGKHILLEGVSVFSYRIGVRYNGELSRIKWEPANGEYIHAPILSSTNTVLGAAGGILTLPNGDQHYGETSVIANAGDLDENTEITITELPAGSKKSSIAAQYDTFVPSQDIQHLYKMNFSKPPLKDLVFNLRSGNNEDYTVVHRVTESGLWQKLDYVKNANGTYTVAWNNDKYGAVSTTNYFALKAASIARNVNASVRPSIRAFMPGGSVTFNNLRDGDSIAVYNLKGKLVRKITHIEPDGTAQWDGKNDGGNYVESGSYIYQVKADGKLISGSLAFVR